MYNQDKALLFVTFDKVANRSAMIFESLNVGTAWRDYCKAFQPKTFSNGQTAPGLDASDYELIIVGEINHKLNTILPCVPYEVKEETVLTFMQTKKEPDIKWRKESTC